MFRRLIAPAAFVLALFVAGYGLGHAFRSPSASVEPLTVSLDDLNIDDVFPTRAFRCEIPLRNTTDAPITVSGITTSCSCSRVEPSGQFVIPPAGQVDLKFVLNLISATDGTGGETEFKPFSVDFRARTADGELPTLRAWKLSGRVETPFSTSPHELEFCGGHRLVHGKPYPTVRAQIVPRQANRSFILSATCDPKIGSCQLSEDLDGEYSLQFTPAPDLAQGPFDGGIQLLNKVDGRFEEIGEVPIYGCVVGKVCALPDVVYLGAIKIGDTQMAEFQLCSISNNDFEIINMRLDPPDEVAQHAIRKQGNKQHSISLPITARKARTNRSVLTATLELSDASIFRVEVPIVYYGLQSNTTAFRSLP